MVHEREQTTEVGYASTGKPALYVLERTPEPTSTASAREEAGLGTGSARPAGAVPDSGCAPAHPRGRTVPERLRSQATWAYLCGVARTNSHAPNSCRSRAGASGGFGFLDDDDMAPNWRPWSVRCPHLPARRGR